MMNHPISENKRISEQEMIPAVLSLFKREGFSFQLKEVQFCERLIDILCLNQSTDEIVAIEAKVNAPSKAFLQASRYKYIADYVYVAILKNGSNQKAVELSRDTGIGLIFIKRDKLGRYSSKIEIKPQRSIYKDEKITKYILNINAQSHTQKVTQ